MIQITSSIDIDESEIHEVFIRASGPGGQNVNKVASAVQLRFDIRSSPNLPPDVAARLLDLARGRVTRDGVLIIAASRHRTQERNRREALERLIALIRKASHAPRPRRRSAPTAASRERRLANKRARSGVKRMRRPVSDDDS